MSFSKWFISKNRWHYICADITASLSLYYSNNPSGLNLRGAYVYPQSNGMYIDSVSIKSQLPINYGDTYIETTRRIFPPIQYLNNSLTVTKLQGASTVSPKNKVMISFKVRNCMVSLPSFTLVNSFPSNNAVMIKTSSASPPVTGTFTLMWNGQTLSSKSWQQIIIIK